MVRVEAGHVHVELDGIEADIDKVGIQRPRLLKRWDVTRGFIFSPYANGRGVSSMVMRVLSCHSWACVVFGPSPAAESEWFRVSRSGAAAGWPRHV